MRKLLIPIQGDYVAPRFDLATEILIVRFENHRLVAAPKTIIMERASEENLCQMAVEENITDLICGGIEELHYNFLIWKKINVLDGVIGDWHTAIDKMVEAKLSQGDIFINPQKKMMSL